MCYSPKAAMLAIHDASSFVTWILLELAWSWGRNIAEKPVVKPAAIVAKIGAPAANICEDKNHFNWLRRDEVMRHHLPTKWRKLFRLPTALYKRLFILALYVATAFIAHTLQGWIKVWYNFWFHLHFFLIKKVRFQLNQFHSTRLNGLIWVVQSQCKFLITCYNER